jgi:hypothetical protein
MNLREFLGRVWRRIPDVLALLVLLVSYHANEASCFIVGNLYPYYQAVPLCAAAMALLSLGLIAVHDWFLRRYAWDALSLQYLNSLQDAEDIPSYRLFQRMTRMVLREGFYVVFVLGPIILGPIVITLLLRPRRTWKTNLAYAVCGSIFSALFWVAFMRGLGMFTWKYIAALAGKF